HDGTNGGLIDVSGITTIDPDVTVNLGGGFESLSDLPGTVILRSGTFSAGSTAPKSKLFTYALSGTELTIASEDFAEGIKEIISAASGGGVTDNYSNVGSLVNRLEHDDRVSRDLHGRLLSNLEKIDALAAKGGASETALKQFVGEEALTAINAQADTLIKVNTALNNRFQAIHNFRQAPSAGYGAAANRFWVNGFGQWNRQKDTNRLKGYDYNLGGLVLGYDRETAAASGLTLGLNGAVTKGTLKNNDGLAETDVRAVNLGLYGTYEFGGGFFIDANLGYGYAENEAEINLLTGGRKTGDFNSHSYQAGLNLGYAFNLGGTTRLTPSAGLQFTHIKQDGWREKIVADPDNDVVANWFDTSKHNFVEIPLNLKLDATFTTESGISVAPELRVGGVIAANNHDSELRLGFVGADDSTTIRGLSPAKSRFTAGAGLKVQLNETVDFFTGYDLEARSGYQGHTASLGLGFSF
ncbi:MAG: autotransporter outer membrane beta-barrel domain-containing protein, partial [Candidatus Adiutrix sp.]|nr:autotransporter outer membrane beta-barrel domain-containing protein [Candidatus Adiutrix sp.]